MNKNNPYTGFIRIRVAGLYVEDGKLLLVKLRSPISGEDIWIPPGGGVNYKEPLKSALVREFFEESNLKIKVQEVVYTNELIEGDFHVIEFYFKVVKLSGEIALGIDPEHNLNEQLLTEIGFFSKEEMQTMNVKPEYLKSDFWN